MSRDIVAMKWNYFFRDSGAATARSTVMPTMGERCTASRVKSCNLPVAGCHYAHGSVRSDELLTSEIPRLQLRQKQSYRPWGCYLGIVNFKPLQCMGKAHKTVK